ncbi:hypothetical protein Pan181_49720 [Aeoliella mucimassa]|uniref:Uncharacterized protein n=2 Tax=Aeoliella mucimassa TaxID=2527972 RepID=A0A518AVK5_9BACT|nr:hypothetical protein Pan181_49720 [Aeoliella mucimassa]
MELGSGEDECGAAAVLAKVAQALIAEASRRIVWETCVDEGADASKQSVLPKPRADCSGLPTDRMRTLKWDYATPKRQWPKIESIEQTFEYEKVDLYRDCIRKYVDAKRELFPESPALVDVSGGKVELPGVFEKRIEDWMERHPEYSPYMRGFARNYLISLLDDSFAETMYEHLAELAFAGGDFYVETGFFYIRDAGAVSSLS